MTAETEQWEYRVHRVKNAELPTVGDDLNRFGSQGWELVSTSTTVKALPGWTPNDIIMIFKRRGVGPFTEKPEDAPGFIAY